MKGDYRFFFAGSVAMSQVCLSRPEYIDVGCVAFIKANPFPGIPGIIQRRYQAPMQ